MRLKLGKIYYEESLSSDRIFYYCIERFSDKGDSLMYYCLDEPDEKHIGDTKVCERHWKEFKGENKWLSY